MSSRKDKWYLNCFSTFLHFSARLYSNISIIFNTTYSYTRARKLFTPGLLRFKCYMHFVHTLDCCQNLAQMRCLFVSALVAVHHICTLFVFLVLEHHWQLHTGCGNRVISSSDPATGTSTCSVESVYIQYNSH